MLRPKRLALVGTLLLVASGVALVSMWAGADLGCVRCDCRFELFTGPLECRWPAWWSVLTGVLFIAGAAALILALMRVGLASRGASARKLE